MVRERSPKICRNQSTRAPCSWAVARGTRYDRRRSETPARHRANKCKPWPPTCSRTAKDLSRGLENKAQARGTFLRRAPPSSHRDASVLNTLGATPQSVDKAKTEYKLTVPNVRRIQRFGIDSARDPSIPVYFGVNVSNPVRIVDRDQGERARTKARYYAPKKLAYGVRAQIYDDSGLYLCHARGQPHFFAPM
jgi:hypothetical protein